MAFTLGNGVNGDYCTPLFSKDGSQAGAAPAQKKWGGEEMELIARRYT